MGLIIVTGPDDPVFVAELRALERSDDWKRFAISGRMSAGLESMFEGDGRGELGNRMQRGYVGAAEDRRAWLWGYHWQEGGPPPAERPEGACPECWRLGDACRRHYKGLSVGEVRLLAIQELDSVHVRGELQIRVGEEYVDVESISFERLQAMVLGHECPIAFHECEQTCEFPGCFVAGCVRKAGANDG